MWQTKFRTGDDMNKFDIQHLDLYYGDFKALKNINLEIQEHGS